MGPHGFDRLLIGCTYQRREITTKTKVKLINDNAQISANMATVKSLINTTSEVELELAA